ncbi:MAG: hypothetical protein HFI09_04195 [Bacilli bacterium]|nr:hypothetical protein [Bacilli bacterium]
MPKFCKYCGKELEKGEKCNCNTEKGKKKNIDSKTIEKKQNSDLQKATETIKTEVTYSSKKYAEKLWKTIQNILLKPKETLIEFINNDDTTLTMIILIITSVIIGICTVSFIKGMYGINLLYTSSYPVYKDNIWNISYFKILVCVALGVFLSHLLLAVIFDLGFEKISKIKLTFKSVLSSIAISILEPTILCIISAILTIFSYKLAFILIIYAGILYILNLYQTFGELREVKSSHYNHLFTILFLIFAFLSIYLIPKLFI